MAKRELVRRIDLERGQAGALSGGMFIPAGGSAFDDSELVRRDGTHDLYGMAKWAWAMGAEVNDTLRSWGPGLLQVFGNVYAGRSEGARIGISVITDDEGRWLVLEGVNDAGVPFFSVSQKLDGTNTARISLGNAESPRRIYMEEPVAAEGTPDLPRGMVVPLQALAELITSTYIDLPEVRDHWPWLVVDPGALVNPTLDELRAELPEPLLYPDGFLIAEIAPWDTNQRIWWYRDADNWALIGGAGLSWVHAHTSAESGGVISGGGGGSPNLDGGLPDSNYGGITAIDAGGI